jgi:DNA repair protein RecO
VSQISLNTQAIVVNTRNNQEKNLQVTILTPNLGKISVIASGAKSIKSTRSQNLQLGNIIKVSLYQKNNLYWLSESQSTLSFLQIDHQLIQLNLLFYFLEILKNFAPENEASPELFNLSSSAITSLYKNLWPKFIKFQIEILNTLGFGAPLNLQQNYQDKKYQIAQQQLILYFESILQKPLFSHKLLTK